MYIHLIHIYQEIYHRKGHKKGYLRFTCFNFHGHFKDFSFMKVVFEYVPTELSAVLKYLKT